MQGKVPKNRFGNIDLYVPSMLPKGAAHIPCACAFVCPPVSDLSHYRVTPRSQRRGKGRAQAGIRLRRGRGTSFLAHALIAH